MVVSDSNSPETEELGRRGAMAFIAMATGLVISYGTATIYGLRYLFGRQKPPRQVQVLSAALSDVPDGESRLAKASSVWPGPTSIHAASGSVAKVVRPALKRTGART